MCGEALWCGGTPSEGFVPREMQRPVSTGVAHPEASSCWCELSSTLPIVQEVAPKEKSSGLLTSERHQAIRVVRVDLFENAEEFLLMFGLFGYFFDFCVPVCLQLLFLLAASLGRQCCNVKSTGSSRSTYGAWENWGKASRVSWLGGEALHIMYILEGVLLAGAAGALLYQQRDTWRVFPWCPASWRVYLRCWANQDAPANFAALVSIPETSWQRATFMILKHSKLFDFPAGCESILNEMIF